MKLLVVPVLALVASVAAPLAPAQAVTATTSAVIARIADNPVTDTAPFSLPIVAGVSGGSVSAGGSEYYGRAVINAHRKSSSYMDESAYVFIPRKLPVGTYAVPADPYSASAIAFSSACGGGNAVIRDVAWTAAGALTRLSMSYTATCSGNSGNSDRVGSSSVEVRFAEPTASALIGEVEGPDNAATMAAQVGTPVTSARTFVNHGSGPATMGTAAIPWQLNTDYPAFSIASDGCKGKTLQVAQSCDVIVRYAPQIAATDQATLTVPDGRPAPAGVRVDGSASQLPDQPIHVVASGQIGSEAVTWYAANVSSTNHSYDGYNVRSVDAAGVVGPIVATAGPGARVAEINGLADRTSYGYVVEAILPGGALGPQSVVVRDTTAGRLLLYSDGGTYDPALTSRGLDPQSHPYVRVKQAQRADHLTVSPDQATVATSGLVYRNGYYSCRLEVLSRTGTSGAVTVPEDVPTCNTYPSFLNDSTLVFSRQDDITDTASSSYLATYDLGSGVVTPVLGGAGLTQPSVAPDGSLVAVDPVGHTLVRLLADGTLTTIDNTTGAEEPAVSPSGTIAFVRRLTTYDRRLTTVEADGSSPVELTAQDKQAASPSWTGTTLYYVQDNQILRTTGTGSPVNVLPNPDYSFIGTPVVLDVPDVSGPVVTAPAMAAFTAASSLTYTVTAADPGPAGSGVAATETAVRSGPVGGALGSSVVTAGSSRVVALTSGQRYCLSGRATDNAGNVGAWSTETCTLSDRALPVASPSALPAFVLSSPVALSWSGTDTGGSGFASYDVRTDKAAASGGFSAWTTVLTHTTARSLSVALGAGSTTCVSVRGNDKAGNVGAWSAQRCTALPLDDRTPVASTGWTRVTGASFYARTASSSTKLGTTLVSGALQTSRLALVASKCSTCGTVGVYVGSTLVGKVNLAGATVTRAVMPLPRISLRSGKVTLKVLTNGQLVRIDGLATSRV